MSAPSPQPASSQPVPRTDDAAPAGAHEGAGGAASTQRPAAEDIDVFGLTHPGLARRDNQDHFLIASLHRTSKVHGTSLPWHTLPGPASESRGYVFLIADGVGGAPNGAQASALAVRAVMRYLTDVVELCGLPDVGRDPAILDQLRESVARGHERVLAHGTEGAESGMATTLTMVTVVWPRAYLVHVGDSRCYRLRDGQLERLTTDQTMAEALRSAGALSADAAAVSRFKDVLWSVIGGAEMTPEVQAVGCERADVLLLCTDGLTRHVSDAEIAEQLRAGADAETTCRALSRLALERGGSDNVTVVVGRIRPAG
jgi:protein phosphatase